MKHEEYVYTVGMDQQEIDELLQSTTTGVLCLADADVSYALPIAHYYDGKTLYFRLGETDQSTKISFLEHTKTARYVVYETKKTEDATKLESWSIVLTGSVIGLSPAEEERIDTSQINRLFPPLRVFGESIQDIDITIVEFNIESAVGRRTTGSK